jgi:hypothetical protein
VKQYSIHIVVNARAASKKDAKTYIKQAIDATISSADEYVNDGDDIRLIIDKVCVGNVEAIK